MKKYKIFGENREKKTPKATVLKQLNEQSLFPLRERIGIYVIAGLSVVGLILITYTGVMAVVTSAIENGNNGDYVAADIDVDVEEVHDILDDVEDLLDFLEDDEEATQDEADLHEYVDLDDEDLDDADDEDPDEDDDEDDEDDEDLDDADDDEDGRRAGTVGTINSNWAFFYRNANDTVDVGALHLGDTIVVYDYNSGGTYRIAVEADNEFGINPVFMERRFIDFD